MSEPTIQTYPFCRNRIYDHECHPVYAQRYDGYCLDCSNAGVPDLVEDLERLRAVLTDVCKDLKLMADNARMMPEPKLGEINWPWLADHAEEALARAALATTTTG